MPWRSTEGREYQLCLLDTNALSEIVKHPTVEGRGFVERFPPINWAPCWTIYNLIEIRRSEQVYEQWLSFFSTYPSFLLNLYSTILTDEIAQYETPGKVLPLLNAFTPGNVNASYDLDKWVRGLFELEEMRVTDQNWREDELSILDSLLTSKQNFNPKEPTANAADADLYVALASVDSLTVSHQKWVESMLQGGEVPEIRRIPSLQIMLYSQYYRLYDSKRKPVPSDVTDVRFTAAVPYMDAVVTEHFQAEIFRKIRTKVLGLAECSICRLPDLRGQVCG